MEEETKNEFRNFYADIDGIYHDNQPDVVKKAPDCFRKLEQANDRIFPTETRADRRILLAKYKVGSMDENTANQFMEEIKNFIDKGYGIVNSS